MGVHARQTRGRDQIRLTLLGFGIANGPECEAITIDRGNVCFLEVRRSGYAHLLVSRQREDRRFPRSSLLFRLLFTLLRCRLINHRLWCSSRRRETALLLAPTYRPHEVSRKRPTQDRKSVVEGKSVVDRGDLR